MNEGTCRSCGAKIIWAKTAAERTMPLDAEPVGDGDMLLEEDGKCSHIRAAARPEFAGKLHKSHFATCAFAATHRKPK